jgi:leader peptidase (prepilin peptidase) / N-methyltransferase
MITAEIVLLAAAFAFGLCFGSFLNVIVYRLPLKLSIVAPPSSCPACKTRLGFFELIPLLGFFLLRGRCRHCGVKISVRYPLVELFTAILFVTVFCRFGFTFHALFYLVLLYILFAVTLIDFEHRIVPNSLVAAGTICAIIFHLPAIVNYFAYIPGNLLLTISPLDAVAGMALGAGLMLIIILVSRGGMGAGDLKLLGMIGLFVGLRGVAVVMLAGFIFGALVGIFLMITGRATRKDALPFAPYLALATVVEVFWGEALWSWYINLLI